MNAKQPKKPDHDVHLSHKRRMKVVVIATLLLSSSIYFFLVLPDQALDRLRDAVGAWANIAARAAGTLVLAPVLAQVLFAADGAFRGGGATAGWIRSQFASQAALRRFGCRPEQASTLWFRYFDTWALERSPNRNLLVNTYSATYSARLIFYLFRSCLILFAATLGTIAIHFAALGTYGATPRPWIEHFRQESFVLHAVVAVLYLAVALLLYATNRPGPKATPTGCWARLADVFARSTEVFEREVLRDSADLDAAFKKVEQIRAKNGRP